MEDDTFIQPGSPDYYYTDAISDQAVRMIEDTRAEEDPPPFFLYVSYTAPHWPLHAREQDIARYEGQYRRGWDALRTARHERMRDMGIVDRRWEISQRDDDAPPWEDAPHKDWEDLRMAVYAAQVDSMDQGIGRIMDALRRHGVEENTLVMFLADNGGCAEFLAEDSNKPQPAQFNTPTVDGRPVRMGNIPEVRPGLDDTFQSYDLPWANASNTPFRLFKHWVHEGGIATPFVVHWPRRIKDGGGIARTPAHFTDIMPTCLEAAGANYPSGYGGAVITPVEGESLLPSFDRSDWERESPIFWEHEGNKALRSGNWKLVSRFPHAWELYNIAEDRTEQHDLSGREPDRIQRMAREFSAWAARAGVQRWPLHPKQRADGTRGRNDHVVGG